MEEAKTQPPLLDNKPQTDPAPRKSLDSIVDDLKSLPYNALFPFSDWFKNKIYNQPLTKAVLILALFPLIIFYAWNGNPTLNDAGWAFGLYFASIWTYILHKMIEPGKVSWVSMLVVALVTIFIGIAVVLFVQKLPIISSLYEASNSNSSFAKLFGFVFGVGIVEEVCKAIPIIWLANGTKDIKNLKQGAFYAGISGLAFGVTEAVGYLYNYRIGDVSEIAQRTLYGFNYTDGAAFLAASLIRLMVLPFLHCMWSAIVGYYIGISVIMPNRRLALIILGVAISAVLHGVYDFLSSSWLGIVIAAISVVVFAGYLYSAIIITKSLSNSVSS